MIPRVFISFGKEKELPQEHPEKGKLIYVGSLRSMVTTVKAFSLSTSILGLSFQPFLYNRASDSDLPLFLKLFMGGFLNVFIFFTPVMLHFITKRYVTSIYYNSKSKMYTATTLNIIINDVNTSFTREQLIVPEIPGLFTSMKVGNKPLFIDPSLFLDKNAYMRMMGYDKPIDWSFKFKDDSDKDQ